MVFIYIYPILLVNVNKPRRKMKDFNPTLTESGKSIRISVAGATKKEREYVGRLLLAGRISRDDRKDVWIPEGFVSFKRIR